MSARRATNRFAERIWSVHRPTIDESLPKRLDMVIEELVLRVRRPMIWACAGVTALFVVFGIWHYVSAVGALARKNAVIEAVTMTGLRQTAVADASDRTAAVDQLAAVVDLPKGPPGVLSVAFYVPSGLAGPAASDMRRSAVLPQVRGDVERFHRSVSHDPARLTLFFARRYRSGAPFSISPSWVERAYASRRLLLANRGPVLYVARPILLRGRAVGVLVASTLGTFGSGQPAWLSFFVPLLHALWIRLAGELVIGVLLLVLLYFLAERIVVGPVRRAAWRDPVSGCYNQVAFWSLVENEASHRKGEPLSLAFIDCDDFKSVNDDFGHEHGDAVLAALGSELRAASGRLGVPGRLGGDEFGLLWLGPAGDAASVVERVRTKLSASGLLPGRRLTLSAGVAEAVAGEPIAVRDLIDAADRALYQAKDAGRDRVVVGDQAPQPGIVASPAPRP